MPIIRTAQKLLGGAALFLSCCLLCSIPVSAQDAKKEVSLQDVQDQKKAVKTKIEILKAGPGEQNADLLSVLQQTEVTLEQFVSLKERMLSEAGSEADSVSAEQSLATIRKDLPRTSFVYLQLLHRELFMLEARLHDTSLVVTSTDGILEDSISEQNSLEQSLRRLRETVQSSAPERFSELEILQARTALGRSLVQYHKELLSVSRAELAQQRSGLDTIRRELDAIKGSIEFTEVEKKQLVADFESRSEKLTEKAQAIDNRLEALEASVSLLIGQGKAGARILFDQIKEARSVLQQSVLSSVLLVDAYRDYIKIQFDYFNSATPPADFQDLRRKLEQTLGVLEDIASWKDRKFSLLVNQLVRVYAEQELEVERSLKQQVEEITAVIGEQREVVRFLEWSISRFLEQTRSRFGVKEGVLKFTVLLGDLWNFEIFVVDERPITISKIVRSLVLFLLGWLASRYLAKRLLGRVLERFPLRSGVQVAIKSISFYILLACFGLLALHLVHIPLTVFTLLGGALAIGIGFGSQNIINNFISGLILLVEQPIRVGDIIEYGGTRGTVEQIGARSTRLLTPENVEIVVPNSHLLENAVTNLTLGSTLIRRSILVGVAYGSPTREVAKLLLKAVEAHGKIHKKPAPEIFFKDFGDSSLVFEVRFWITIVQYSDALRVESDLRYIVDQKFRDAAIVIAFPQRDVHLGNNGKPLVVRVTKEESPAPQKEVGKVS